VEEAIKVIFERRSCRGFAHEPVSDEALHILLRAGMYAPSVRNTKPWEFIVLRDEATRTKIAATNRNWGMLGNAPLGIIVGVKGNHESLAIHYQQECGASTQNILLAAQAMGLGGVWLGLYPDEERVKAVRRICDLPEEVLPVTLIAIGHPTEMPPAHTKFYEDKVHYDRF
jgi:nitroreductase